MPLSHSFYAKESLYRLFLLSRFDAYANIKAINNPAVGIFGGACAEWLTMLLIRHKTRKKKFMVTLPVFAVVHLAVIFGAFYLVTLSMAQA